MKLNAYLILVIAIVIYSLVGLAFVTNSRARVLDDLVALANLSVEMDQLAGYGGIIHDFKNFVLRGDPAYRERVLKNHERVLADLDEVEAIARRYEFNVSYEVYRETLDEYRSHLPTIARLHAEGRPVMQIDRRVVVNDGPALAEYRQSTQALVSGISRLGQQAAQWQAFLSVAILVSSAMAIWLVVLIFAKRRRRLEREAVMSRENALLSEQVQTLELFSSASAHDLRGPLQQIVGIAEDLESRLKVQRDLDPSPALQRIVDQVMQASNLIDSLVQYARSQVAEDPAAIADTRHAVNSVKRLYENLPRYRVSVSGHFDRVMADGTEVELVIRNLVDNAIKHHDAESGEIKILGVREGDTLEISVCDDGPGITDSARRRIFLPFVTAGRRNAGSGLGLALVNRIVRKRGGNVEVTPNSPRGTVFKTVWHLASADPQATGTTAFV